MDKITIATRKSPLALKQALLVKASLAKQYPKLIIKLLKITTQGDRNLNSPLANIGGKGLFIKELEVAMQQGLADMAVHSAKDMPYKLPNNFALGAILKRENPYDALISGKYNSIAELPKSAKVGTSSLRRQAQLLALRPDLKLQDLRGNINTRLKKLDRDDYDVIILACAGLLRLNLGSRIKQQLPTSTILPAVGQGALAIEIRHDDKALASLIKPLICKNTTACVLAERAMNARLEGSCSAPIAGFATTKNNQLFISGLVGSITKRKVIKASTTGDISKAQNIGKLLADKLLAKGAKQLLNSNT